jgi:hypothetical protein
MQTAKLKHLTWHWKWLMHLKVTDVILLGVALGLLLIWTDPLMIIRGIN